MSSRTERKDRIPIPPDDSRLAPNDAGSIEQHLDMIEGRGLHGEGILRREPADHQGLRDLDEDAMESNFHVDMAETWREGDDESGDEHSAGLQGDEQELEHDPHVETGLPGDETEHEEMEIAQRRRRIPPGSTPI